ncbi:MAG: bifunctional phosphoglucose/phosphomannose isomerase [SAR202 cluster bacterium MP-SInd-SRR3963457-G2]|jgi:glucose/mannose-6-phosphate isomerase|nr:MAG: bifunctional phosphoglucose/phosphomannose isomerase [SAR202 cluster bacterium MP-SInd-SRR3963457-G2]HIM79006.1 bifunctional phosphoglucose/phosphomannose isomerase [Dehalococcoidia bacterium]|tara:strand:- start:1632 stop:2693 length:1062 start_codon:yes stop_codon:yes gene_type:complete
MHKLDDQNIYAALDPSRLGERIAALPGQCGEAWQQISQAELPGFPQPQNQVVICGMGGSAIAGDLAADLAQAQGGLPITVVRDFRLPFKPDNRTLVIACSYSGETLETLSLFQEAVKARSAVVAITSGGTLAGLATESGAPVLPVATKGEPRNAVGYNLMLLLGLLNRLGLVETRESDVQSAIEAARQHVARIEPDRPAESNTAKQIALELHGKVPLIYGGGIFRGMARRWKTQFNENAKVWAFFEAIPELLHNSVEAYPDWAESGIPLTALVLQPNTAPEESSGHYEVLAELLRRHTVPHRVLMGGDGSQLVQLLNMLVLGDYVSYYLAMLKGVDPSETPSLQEAKRLLSEL